MSTFENGLTQDMTVAERDWRAVGGFLRQAMEEVAAEISDGAAEHTLETMGYGILPDPAALLYLERLQSGSAEWIITRSAELQSEAHQREWAAATSFRSKAKAFGKGLLWLVP